MSSTNRSMKRKRGVWPAFMAMALLLALGSSGVLLAGEAEGKYGPREPGAGEKKAKVPAETEEKGEALKPPEKPKSLFLSIKEGFKIKLYGHLRLDGSWDDAETNNGNTAMWVKRNQDKEEMNITCRHTRVGMDLEGPKTFGVLPSGKIEIDFYGKGSGSEVLQNLRLRHAFVKFDLGDGFSLLGGQWFDVHGRLFMRTLNTAVGWNHGNLCFRRPQIRFGKKFMLGEKASLLAELGLARAIGKTNGGDLDGGDPKNDDGEDAARPDVQLNFTVSIPAWEKKKPIKLMFGGHYGQENLKTVPKFIKSWSWVADLCIPVVKGLSVEAEFWMGLNVDSYRGGIQQGYNMAMEREVLSRGGFAQLLVGPIGRFSFTSGGGIDDPYNGHVSTNKPCLNRSLFANVKFTVCKGGWIGLEYQRFWTEYLRARTAMDNRFQLTLYLKY